LGDRPKTLSPMYAKQRFMKTYEVNEESSHNFQEHIFLNKNKNTFLYKNMALKPKRQRQRYASKMDVTGRNIG
jgi:hypothetical protein